MQNFDVYYFGWEYRARSAHSTVNCKTRFGANYSVSRKQITKQREFCITKRLLNAGVSMSVIKSQCF